jgi:hypothetical protein
MDDELMLHAVELDLRRLRQNSDRDARRQPAG